MYVGENTFIGSGFAAQGSKILEALSKKHEVHACLWSYNGTDPIIGAPYKCYPLSMIDYWGVQLIPRYLDRIRPDAVFTYGDPHFMNERGHNILHEAKIRELPVAAYLAIDSENHTLEVKHVLDQIDYPVFFTNWAREIIAGEFPETAPKLRTIYHGVKPMKVVDDDKKLEFKSLNGFQGRYIVGSVFRNCIRKHPERLMRAFRKVLEQIPNAMLLLHTQPVDVARDCLNIVQLADYMGFKKSELFISKVPNPTDTQRMATEEELNKIYGMMDVHVLTSGREGWGLPLIEAAMAGRASIGTNYASMTEILADDRGWLVDYSDWYPLDSSLNFKDVLIDIDKLADTIVEVWRYPKEAALRAQRLRRWTQEHCEWGNIQKQWVTLFDEIEKKLPPKAVVVPSPEKVNPKTS
jgi:glycosyltransferase involved in cell wall biosynthesis